MCGTGTGTMMCEKNRVELRANWYVDFKVMV